MASLVPSRAVALVPVEAVLRVAKRFPRHQAVPGNLGHDGRGRDAVAQRVALDQYRVPAGEYETVHVVGQDVAGRTGQFLESEQKRLARGREDVRLVDLRIGSTMPIPTASAWRMMRPYTSSRFFSLRMALESFTLHERALGHDDARKRPRGRLRPASRLVHPRDMRDARFPERALVMRQRFEAFPLVVRHWRATRPGRSSEIRPSFPALEIVDDGARHPLRVQGARFDSSSSARCRVRRGTFPSMPPMSP